MAINAAAREWLRRAAEVGDLLGAVGEQPWLHARLDAPARLAMGARTVIRWSVPITQHPIELFDGVQWRRVHNNEGQLAVVMPQNDLTVRLRVGPRVACNQVIRLIRLPATIGVEPQTQVVSFGDSATFRVYACDTVETLFREQGHPWAAIPNEAEVILTNVISERRAEVAARGTDGVLVVVQLVAKAGQLPTPITARMQQHRQRWVNL